MSGLRNTTIDKAKAAYIDAMLDDLREPLKRVAAGLGYVICYHGSRARDLDIIAVPWTENACTNMEEVAHQIAGAIRAVMGRAYVVPGSAEKPHGRKAFTIIHNDSICEIDLSIVPAHSRIPGNSVNTQVDVEKRSNIAASAIDLIEALKSEAPQFTATNEQKRVISELLALTVEGR